MGSSSKKDVFQTKCLVLKKARYGDKLISCVLHICRNSASVFLPYAAPQDYIVISTHLLLTPSETRKCINITLLDDSIVEEREKFALELASSEVGILLNPNKTTITIQDTDRKSLHKSRDAADIPIIGQLSVIDTVYGGENQPKGSSTKLTQSVLGEFF